MLGRERFIAYRAHVQDWAMTNNASSTRGRGKTSSTRMKSAPKKAEAPEQDEDHEGELDDDGGAVSE